MHAKESGEQDDWECLPEMAATRHSRIRWQAGPRTRQSEAE